MLSRIINFSSILLLLFLVSCGSSDDSDPQPPTRTYADVEADFQALDLQAGNNDVSIISQDGVQWTFRVVIPEGDLSNNPRPLVMHLHGASGGNPDAHKITGCYAEPGFAAINPIIISPNGGTMDWLQFSNQAMVLTLIDLAINNLPVDTSKIVVNGYSNGGNGAWFYGETQPTLISAAIPMASSYNTYNTQGNPRKIDVPLYVIHGENDELFPIAQTEEWVNATKDAGTDVTFEVAAGLTHNEPCSYVENLKNAATWLQDEVWN